YQIRYALFPRTSEVVIQHLLPVLKQRGLFWDWYAVKGGTYQENIYGKKGVSRPPADHPATKYH
ncbi:hypothetical protein C8A01DRAFT_21575, partial [Parachaetomium inaequale]